MSLRDFMTSIPKERPTGITILAVLCFISGAYTAAGALAGVSILFRGGAGGMLVYPVHAIIFLLTIALFFGKGAFFAFIGIGLIKLQNWARITLIVLFGLLSLIFVRAAVFSTSHALAFSPFPVVIGGLTIAIILAYLFQPHVKQAFGATRL